ncbi:type VI secretion system-associated FHA domain protein TagH [Marinobacter sp. X15-166B]|uniref:type VI secretion system-associated FHA domain protein TagH n=1 Tax=Marinobacter sp. X15-166B TaxID=1897620 RepID=UPI00085BEC36|nr:type VI secretion system-associated FHA domain protein TagH [Marinobacter sp. X15-166B]OEY65826.1 hypothetical protein BG841_04740 [Marinobacter sp. X15-166B]
MATKTITLTVSNPQEVGSDLRTAHRFCGQGGSIGTAASDTWQLSTHRTGVVAGHAEIRLIDGVFCLIDRSGRTFLNSTNQPLGRGRRARLRNGDTVIIGRYQLQAQVHSGKRKNAGDDMLVEPANARLSGNGPALQQCHRHGFERPGLEPLQHLGGLTAEPSAPDPGAGRELTDEYPEQCDVALSLPVIPSCPANSRAPAAKPDTPAAVSEPADTTHQHLSAAPLLRGMGERLRFTDGDAMWLFLEEAGQTLRAAIEGLLALHQQEHARHQVLRTHLQPLEDNPLRLGQDYATTVQSLFASQRSPVHLSAPAAVRDSLIGLGQHQQATQVAISAALKAILQAFSPEALLRRFHGYRRGLREGEPEAEWAWQMYEHYYRELSSSRQQGFERLFREVFEQAYDHQLRELQRESIL